MMILKILQILFKTNKFFVGFVLVLVYGVCSERAQYVNNANFLLPPTFLGAPTHQISGEHISLNFYAAVEKADNAKNILQSRLQNFLEILQRNLTTSGVFNTVVNISTGAGTQRKLRKLQKLNELSGFFQFASEEADKFALESEHFFEVSKNESYALLLKLRQVPSAQRFLPMSVKLRLTNYFDEMEFLHVMFSEVVDQALEYIVDTLRSTQRTFISYAEIQKDILNSWKTDTVEDCYNRYMDFLQKWSAEIFKCAAGNELSIAYDVYAMTEVNIKHILRQLEFRIQRLFNCFLFGNYGIRCSFLRHAEKDFEKLFAKLDELQIYYDIKTKGGRVSIYRNRRRRENEPDNVDMQDKCIPYGFPETKLLSSLKYCFPNFVG